MEPEFLLNRTTVGRPLEVAERIHTSPAHRHFSDHTCYTGGAVTFSLDSKEPLDLRSGEDGNRWFIDWIRSGVGYRSADPVLEALQNEWWGEQSAHAGSHWIEGGRVWVELGRRRIDRVTEQQVSASFYFLQFSETVGYSPRVARPQFYPSCISPHIVHQCPEHPVEWARIRMEYILGYAHVFGGHDYLIGTVEQILGRLAGSACNVRPESHYAPRSFPITPELDGLLTDLEDRIGDPLLPEVVILAAELSQLGCGQALKDAVITDCLGQIATCLDNGFNIDRLITFVRDRKANQSVTDLLRHGLTLTCAVFTGENRPWWFKEDFDLTTLSNDDPVTWPILESLARSAGYAAPEAIELYRRSGAAFEAAAAEVRIAGRLAIVAEVATLFGINNVDRAVRVLGFCCEVATEAPRTHKVESLQRLLAIIRKHAPTSPLMGVLEGRDAGFGKPGLYAVIDSNFGSMAGLGERYEPLTIDSGGVRSVVALLSTSIRERAYFQRTLAGVNTTALQLIEYYDREGAAAAALPVHVQVDPAPPLHRWLSFEERLHAEVPYDTHRTAAIYFSFFAPKLPDPLAPPPGFLATVHQLTTIRDTDYEFPYLHHPDHRPRIIEGNLRSQVNRYLCAAHILDAQLMGVISWPEAERMFDWIVHAARPERAILGEPLDPRAKELRFVNVYIGLLGAVNTLRTQDAIQVSDGRSIVAALMRLDFSDPTPLMLLSRDENAEREFSGVVAQAVRMKVLSPDDLRHEVLEASGSAGHSRAFVTRLLALTQAIKTIDSQGRKLRYAMCRVSIEPEEGDLELAASLASLKSTAEGFQNGHLAQLKFDELVDYWTREITVAAKHAVFGRAIDTLAPHSSRGTSSEEAVERANNDLYRALVLERFDFNPRAIHPLPRSGGAIVSLRPPESLTSIVVRVRRIAAEVAETYLPFRRAARRESFGLLAIGAKIHLLHPVDGELFNQIIESLGLTTGGFKLDQANLSIVLPPSPSGLEVVRLLRLLKQVGLVDDDYPEVQLTSPGRLPVEDCGYLGVMMVLGTKRLKQLTRSTFATSHEDLTGFRLIIYDAGGGRDKFPFDTTIEGRTDALGRWAFDDVSLFQQLKTILTHYRDGGPFGVLRDPLVDHLKRILSHFGLSDVLNTEWVHIKKDYLTEADVIRMGAEHFDRSIEPLVKAWHECNERAGTDGYMSGPVGEVLALIGWMNRGVLEIQEGLLTSPKYETERRLLLA